MNPLKCSGKCFSCRKLLIDESIYNDIYKDRDALPSLVYKPESTEQTRLESSAQILLKQYREEMNKK